MPSSKAGDLAIFSDIDPLGGGNIGETRHGHDVPAIDHHEPCPGADRRIGHDQGETLGPTQKLRIVGEGVLGFGYADRQPSEASLLQLFCYCIW